MEDDLGTSYYFRGDVTNNYVYFAGYYWRIIRINGDGTVRMIYDGTSKHANGESSTDRSIGSTYFSGDYNIDYIYSKVLNYMETNWYPTLSAADKTHIANAIYCNKKEVLSERVEEFIFETYSYAEIYSYYFDEKNISLYCPRVEDRYTLIDSSFETLDGLGTSQSLNIPVGLITSEEIVLAGGVFSYNNSNSKYYLYETNNYWTMSPYHSRYESDLELSYRNFYFSSFGYQFNGSLYWEIGDNGFHIRPVISLNSDALQYSATSNGSIDYPFVVG